MTTGNTTLLKLALPVQGELDGAWGNVVNQSITELVDTAVAGATSLVLDANVTLTDTELVANQSRQAILLCTGARTAITTITAPARSKAYIVINATTGGYDVKLVGAGPTTGVTFAAGEKSLVAWNGSDFVKVSTAGGGGSFTTLSASGAVTFSGLSASQAVFTDGSDNLVSNAITGTGNVVMSASPTLTGTATVSALTASSTVTGNGNWVIGNADTDTITVGASYVNGTVLRSAKAAGNTLNLAAYDVDGTAYTNLVTLTAGNTPTLALNSTGVGTINNMSIGATTASTGAFTSLTSSDGATIQTMTVGLGGSAVTNNTAVGLSALDSNTALGGGNTAIGYGALANNTDGGGNTAVGSQALASNATGGFNTATGYQSLSANNTGSDNTANGYRALFLNTNGNTNTATGSFALSNNNTGSDNTAYGSYALSGILGSSNTAIGSSALAAATTGNGNVAIGAFSGSSITTGSNNVIIGGYLGLDVPINATGSNWVVLSDGIGNVRQAMDATSVQSLTGAAVVYAPAPDTTISAATTLTNAQILPQIVVTSGTSFTLTMPIGTTLETLVAWATFNLGFDFSVINTASGTITLDATETGVTSVGTMTILTGISARFRIRRTAANTFIVYRLG